MASPANNEQGHICIRCDGEFVIALTTPGATVHVDYAFLQPGRELRAGDGPFLKSGADALRSMGVRAIRVGGGFAGPDYYFWKRWTGEPSARPSDGAKWGSCLLSGFGPFEAIDLCEELGIEPVITTSAMGGPDYRRCLGAGPPHDHHGSGLPCSCCNASEMGDLIEYAWGDASTTGGRQRIADGHERPYKVRFFELGNVRTPHLHSVQLSRESTAEGMGAENRSKRTRATPSRSARWRSVRRPSASQTSSTTSGHSTTMATAGSG